MARRYTARKLIIKATSISREELEYIRKNHRSSIILLILYLVGMFCLVFNIHEDFILLTPLNLLVSLAIVLYAHQNWNIKTVAVLFLIFGMGLGIEILGVGTGLIFGEYEYGKVLGPKIWDTPVMIGVNWVMLTYCCCAALNRFFPEGNVFFKSFLGALALVSLDLLIEPVAIIYDFWSWGSDNIIPLQNYLAWFMISFFFLLIIQSFIKDLKNNAGFTLFNLQFIFFLVVGIRWY